MSDDIFIFDKTGTVLKGVNSRCYSLKSIALPEGVSKIGEAAFYDCKSLESIDQPEGLTEIGSRAFLGCTNLTSITVDKGNTVYFSKDGVLYRRLENGKNELVRYPEGKAGESFKVSADSERLGVCAFHDCESLKSIDLPEGLTEICGGAFRGCTNLKSIHSAIIDLENVEIDDNAFEDVDKDECILYVPDGTQEAYRHHPVFSKFKNIETE